MAKPMKILAILALFPLFVTAALAQTTALSSHILHDSAMGHGVINCAMRFSPRSSPNHWYNAIMYAVEVEQEDDGRWIAEVPELPGVMTYGRSRAEAIRQVQILSLRVLADRLEHGEPLPEVDAVFSIVA